MLIRAAPVGLFFLLSTLPNLAKADVSPLLEQVYSLQCADNQEQAKQELEKLRSLSISISGLPAESIDLSPSFLTAGSLDITLDTLVKTADKYPELRRLVERTLLRWDYCQVFEDGQFYDLQENKPRNQVSYIPPLNWTGFKNLGFLDPPASFIPKLLSQSPLGERAFEHFFHRIYREQCFPHHITGKLYRQQYRVDRSYLISKKTTSNNHYPYQWNTSCSPEKVAILAPPPPPPQPIIEEEVVLVVEMLPELPIVVEKPEVVILIEEPSVTETQSEPEKQLVNIEPIKKAPIIIAKTHKPTPKKTLSVKPDEPALPAQKQKKKTPAEATKLPSIPDKTHVVIKTAVIPSSSNSSPISNVISENPDKTHGFTGNVYTKQSLSAANPTIGVNASWKPIADSYWFIRGGLDYDYKSSDPLTYSWGLGYDDWHEGTWSAQINNWGPIKPEEGLAWDKAIANIGYKFKSETLASYNLHANSSLDIPITGDPALNLGMQWNPIENWYIRDNIHKPLNGEPSTWSYGFGYSNWRTNKFNLEYSNYGANELFDTNFRESGVISLSYNWEF